MCIVLPSTRDDRKWSLTVSFCSRNFVFISHAPCFRK